MGIEMEVVIKMLKIRTGLFNCGQRELLGADERKILKRRGKIWTVWWEVFGY